MAVPGETDGAGRARAQVDLAGRGRASASTGLSVLDHLLGVLAVYAGFDVAVEVAPGGALEEAESAGRALGGALAASVGPADGPRHGAAELPADEALALVAVELSGRPRVVSNVDLTAARVGGQRSDVVGRFLHGLAEGAGLTLHVRLLEGEETDHVLEAIFKALGVALADACRPDPGKE